MLNKDQYNQDEYNNYYKQETEGAEIKGYSDDEGGFMKKAILFLGLIALGVAGYFGFKTFSDSSEGKDNTTKEKIVIKEEQLKTSEKETNKHEITIKPEEITKEINAQTKAVEEKIEQSIQKEVASQIKEKLENNQKMSEERISKIINRVMSSMKEEQTSTAKNDDNDLLSALEKSDKDTVKATPKADKPIIVNSESAIEKKVENIPSNNKVTVNNNSNNNGEDLTELSEQIKKLLNMAGANDTTTKKSSQPTIESSITNSDTKTSNYEKSLVKEIKVRTNEMRIIVVRPGDTLNKIAKRAYGNPNNFQKIFDANPEISRADRIYVGQKLRIPK